MILDPYPVGDAYRVYMPPAFTPFKPAKEFCQHPQASTHTHVRLRCVKCGKPKWDYDLREGLCIDCLSKK